MKIISGGQRGADRAALEAALHAGLETGGWAPHGYWTTDGKDPELHTLFGIQEMPFQPVSLAQQYVMRSCKNVDESDVTIAFRLFPSVGTDKTIGYAQTCRWEIGNFESQRWLYRPCLIITSVKGRTLEAQRIYDFLVETQAKIVNVAGHRASKAPAYFTEDVYSILSIVFRKLLS